MSTDEVAVEKNTDKKSLKGLLKNKFVIAALGLLLITVTLVVGLRAYQYVATPAVVRQPAVDHYHFRTQIFYDGKPVNFADEKFQETYVGGQCSADLPDTPIHFHDNTDQMTHIHWNGMTGGMMLKYYGLNLIGGPDDKLGWRFDTSYINPKPIPVRTDALSDVPNGHNIYVFMNTDDGFKEKPIFEFIEQDLEMFFEKRSNLGQVERTWYSWLLPRAAAHAGEIHEEDDGLERLNNLIGDVAIYVQAQRPSDQQVTEAFENLIDLPESTCGG